MLTNAQAASLAQLVVYAFDQFQADPDELEPKPDSRLAGNWHVLGYLTAMDCLFRRGRTVALSETVCYGYLAQEIANPNVYVVAVRGTKGILEWVEDAKFLPTPHPVAGLVESGFYSIYSGMEYRPIGAAQAQPAAQAIAAAIGQGELIVIGHSMGSALATYLTFDLAALLGTRVQGYFFASPRPGNAVFAKAFDERVATYTVYNYELDIVPQVPLGLGYTDLSRTTWIDTDTAQARIAFSLTGHHHLLSYMAMLFYALLDWHAVPLYDRDDASSIKGPSL